MNPYTVETAMPNGDMIDVLYFREEWKESRPTEIDREEYERWLDVTGKLDREDDGHEWQMPIEDYWMQDSRIIYKDIAEYIFTRTGSPLQGIYSSMMTVLDQYGKTA
jgi:hypothetical protein